MHQTTSHRGKKATVADVADLNDLRVVPSFVDTLRAAGLDSLDALFGLQDAQSLTKPGLQSWRERLRFEMNHGGQRRTFYMKRFTHPPAAGRKEVRQAANGARSVAGIEWNWMRVLAKDGIPCTRPVAFGEEFHRGREVRSAAIMEAVPGESLEKWVASPPSPPGRGVAGEGLRRRRDTQVNAIANELAQLVARFHSRGYAHRDLYLAHIFHDPSAAPGQTLRLIDLQRVFRPRVWQSRWFVKDLAALNYSTPVHVASRTDRLRWLMEYLNRRETQRIAGGNRGSLRTCKRLAIRIAAKTQQIANHDERRMSRGDGAETPAR